MKSLEARIVAIEAQRGRMPTNQADVAWLNAFQACYRALVDALPQSHINTHIDKCEALSGRIKNGDITENDQRVLDSLPVDALNVMGMTAGELVTWIQAVSDSF